MKKIQQGFTLIELMIVVAIIGILAAVAIPAYQDYIVKAKLSKVTAAIDPVKLAIAAYYQEVGGYVPVAGVSGAAGAAWTSLGLSDAPTTTTEASGIAMTACAAACDVADPNTIVVTLNNVRAGTIDLHTVTMTPTAGTTSFVWANTCQQAGGASANDPIMLKYFNCP